VVPEPENKEIAPPVTLMSSDAKFVAASDNVNVIVSVSPVLSVPKPEREIDTVGAVVSTVTELVEAAERLFEASVAYNL
jgi:hypothetical protein